MRPGFRLASRYILQQRAEHVEMNLPVFGKPIVDKIMGIVILELFVQLEDDEGHVKYFDALELGH